METVTHAFSITEVAPIAAKPAAWSLYLAREVLPASRGGFSATVEFEDGSRWDVSRLDGEDGWIIDGLYTAAQPWFPVFFNGIGSRCTILRPVTLDDVTAALDAAVALPAAEEAVKVAQGLSLDDPKRRASLATARRRLNALRQEALS